MKRYLVLVALTFPLCALDGSAAFAYVPGRDGPPGMKEREFYSWPLEKRQQWYREHERQERERSRSYRGPQPVAATQTDLISDLQHPDARVRHRAAFVLREKGTGKNPEAKQAIPALVKALQDPDSDVRWVAAGSLGYFGTDAKDAVPALKKTLSDQSSNVRQAAAEALKKIQP